MGGGGSTAKEKAEAKATKEADKQMAQVEEASCRLTSDSRAGVHWIGVRVGGVVWSSEYRSDRL